MKILCRVVGAGKGKERGGEGREHRAQSPCFKLREKAPFSVFLLIYNKNILKQQHTQNPAKTAEIDY